MEHPTHIFITESLAMSIHNLIRATADRGAFKLDEFGPVHQIATQLAEAIEINRVEPEAIEAETTETTI